MIPFDAVSGDVELLGRAVPWFVPMGVVVVVSTAFAYATGVFGATRLGARVASFVGLVEVLFAVLLSWILLGEAPTVIQALGGGLIVTGVVLVRSGDRSADRDAGEATSRDDRSDEMVAATGSSGS